MRAAAAGLCRPLGGGPRSGLRSGGTATYPSGLVVGYVEQMRSDDSNMNEYAILTPAAALDKLEKHLNQAAHEEEA